MTYHARFKITVGEFSGSLETLLELVQKRKMHISEVSLASIADEYIAHVRSLEALPQEQTAEFIVVAATLLLIKSKSILPNLELDMAEEECIKNLEERLQLYGIYKDAKDALAAHVKDSKALYPPKHIKIEREVTFAPADNLSLETLSKVMIGILGQLPLVESKPKAEIVEAVNIEDVMQRLLRRVEGAVQQSFTSISGGKSEGKQELLVHFLALLELVKDGVLRAEQGQAYGDILISR